MLNHFCKKPLWECTKALADVAQGRKAADAVVKNAKLVNVCTAEIQEGVDVAIAEGRIAYIGNADHCIGDGTQVIDAQGHYIAPGFLDGHIHVESSMMGAGEYARGDSREHDVGRRRGAGRDDELRRGGQLDRPRARRTCRDA